MTVTPEIITIGEAIVDLIATQPLSAVEVESFQKCFGGSPLNTAIGIARLGSSVGAIAALGEDHFGCFLSSILKANGVDTAYIAFKKDLRTTLAFVINDPRTGERYFNFYRTPWMETADSNLVDDDFSLNYVKSAKILHISGFALSQEPSRSTILRGAREAKKAGVMISLDPTLRRDVWDSARDMRSTYEEALQLADVASLSQEEAEGILGSSDPKEVVDAAFNFGITILGLKRGDAGSIIADKEGAYVEAEAIKVIPVDTTGAGDAWNAAFLVGLVEDWPLEACGLIANSVGALVVTAKGAITAFPTRDRLSAFLSEQGLTRRLKKMGVPL